MNIRRVFLVTLLVLFVVSLLPSQSTAQSNQFNQYLYRGMSGDQVTSLQRLLAQNPSIYPEGLVTGYFGPATEAAVRRFQAQNGLVAVGMVGPQTRLVLNSSEALQFLPGDGIPGGGQTSGTGSPGSGAGTSGANTGAGTSMPIVVVSPNGGESVSLGSKLKIEWKGSSSFGSTDKVTLYLMPAGFLISVNQPLSGSYEWTVPATSSYVMPGNHTIKAVRDSSTLVMGSRVSFQYDDSSDASFSITAPSPSQHLESVSLTAGPLNSDQTYTLTLFAVGADYCYWSSNAGGNSVTSFPAYKNVTPTQTTTYSATCYNTAYDETKNISVNVTVSSTPPPPSAPTVTLTANPTTITTTGGSSRLTWTSSNATSCTSSWASGSVATSDSTGVVVSPTATINYTITCRNSAGATASDSKTVTVSIPPPGGPTTAIILNVSSSGATSIPVSGSISGTSGTTNYTVTTTAPNTIETNLTAPDVTGKTFSNWTGCNSANGKICSVMASSVSTPKTVTANYTTSTPPSAPTVTLTASPTSITSGQSSTLTWSSANTANCDASSIPGGGVAARTYGSISVSPTTNTTYTISCYNSAGQSTTGSASVNVASASGLPDYVISATATPSSPSINQETLLTITWTNSGTVSGRMPSASVTNYSGASFLRVGDNSCLGKSTIAAGESCNLKYYISFPTVGSKTISLVVDNTNIATESNENNNTGSLVINVGSTSQSIDQLTQIASIYQQLVNLMKQLEELKTN